ncbi:non-ribosomal peptide synthetase, partial [Pseudomonas sp.]|uniref:non-ribosomal peptide synthetase n=1 Tax=Pseudomonas sp. TaxID=306 RepID=UPI0026296761
VSTVYDCAQGCVDSVPIGQPLAGRRSLVLDADLNPVPIGVAGELCIGGIGLARGYHGRQGLSAESFIADPTSSEGGRLYRTGDLVRYRANGVIEYLGRIDHQLKIRGFRIELGEIEARILERGSVRETVVVARDDQGKKMLVGYLVPARAEDDSTALRNDIVAWLQAQLPDYMVPTQWVLLDALPLNPNGKIDRKALPAPSFVSMEVIAPRNVTEQVLVDIWKQLLRVEQLGVTDNFFELGGDSIISLQVVSRARRTGIALTPKDLFQNQTIEKLARVARVEVAALPDHAPVSGACLLTPIQRWFFDEPIPLRDHWNQALLLQPSTPLNAKWVEQALAAIVEHHDALRLSFANGAAQHQPIATISDLFQHSKAADSAALSQLCNAAQASLNLEHGPLLRAVLVKMADGSQRLLLVVHHLVVDGVSWRVLLEDLQLAYDQSARAETIVLPGKTSAYQAWAQRLQTYAETPAMQAELSYWQSSLTGASNLLPGAKINGSQAGDRATQAFSRLDAETTRRLLQEAPAAYRTQVNDLLLTALSRVLCRWTGQDSALINLEGHGREDLFDDIDLSRTVGWFTSQYPVRLTPMAEAGASIKAIKEQLRAVPNKGIGYGVLRYLAAEPIRQALAALPTARVTFNYLGQFDAGFEQALLAPARENSGLSQNQAAPLDNWLSLNGQVYGDTLSIAWTFSHEVFEPSDVQRLAEDYQHELQLVIAHCLDPLPARLTPSDVPLAGLNQARLDALPISTDELADLYPLAPMQQGMLFHSLYSPEAAAYVDQLRVDIDGIDVERFRSAWQAALDAHDILRAGFLWGGDQEQPLQAIRQRLQLPMQVLDWREQLDLSSALEHFAKADQARGFDLAQPPLLRLTLLRTGASRHHLIYTSHHILLDGWSTSQLFGEVMQRYAGHTPRPAGRFADYLTWLHGQDADVARDFWVKQCRPLQEPTRLAAALARTSTADDSFSGHADHHRVLDAQRTQQLSLLSRGEKITLNTLVQSAWLLILQRCTGQPAVTMGVTVSGRPADLPGVEQQLGLFINTLPVIGQPAPELTASQWLQAVQAQNLTLRDHEYTPLGDIQRWAGHPGEALFDTLLVFENYPIAEQLQEKSLGQDLTFSNVRVEENTNYPLTLSVLVGEQILLEFGYQHQHFDALTIEWLGGQLEQLMVTLLDNPQARLGELGLMTATEQLARLNPLVPTFDYQQNICTVIEAQAERRPDAQALVFGRDSVTYAQMNARANRLAHKLRELGAGPEVRIGVALNRSLDMAIALLAVLKSGAAYVPLDPNYPAQRLAYMAQDSQIALLLRDSDVLQIDVPSLDLEPSSGWFSEYPETNPQAIVASQNLAYVIYTSGSTGNPKGVLIDHLALADFCHLARDYCGLTEQDRVLQFATYSFDGFVEQLFPSLCEGACVVIRDAELWDSERLYQEIIQQRITLADLPAAYWHVFVQDCLLAGPRSYGSLRQVHAGGEAMSVEGVRLWATAGLGQVKLVNTYGPTEATVVSTVYDCAQGCVDSVPIGQPLAGRRSLVLDADLNPVPIGVAGELCIGGSGLARGYHGRPGLSAESFIADPTSSEGGRLYRTGDLVRYRANGVIEYLGRIDHQLKIRGFRVETGEIEARILELDSVRETLVMAREEQGSKYLVGYLVPVSPAADANQLRQSVILSLHDKLPDYMVPTQWMVLDALPLNPNGKIDRKALPAPSFVSMEVIAPRTATEQALVDIWKQLLRVDQLGVTDNFFELGGDSIISLQVVSRARRAGIVLTPKDLFQNQTIEKLARVARVEVAALPDHAPVSGACLLTPIQRWFFDEPIPLRNHWNQALLLQPSTPLNAKWVEQALAAIVEHHDALRLSFANGAAQHQPIATISDLFQQSEAADSAALTQLCNAAQASLNLEHGPLLRAVLVEMADGSQRLLLVIHHLVVDGVSWRVLLEDLQLAYDQSARAETIMLPGKTSAYQAWAQRLQAHVDTPFMQTELGYWRTELTGAAADLPMDGDPSADSAVLSVQTNFDRHLTQRLLKQAPAAYRTQVNELLLTALARVLCRWTGQDSALIQLEGHGREDLFDGIDLSRTVGWFTSLYPLKLTPASELGNSIKNIKEQLRSVPGNGLGYGALRYLGTQAMQQELAQLPLARVTFNYLGQLDGSFGKDQMFSLATESAGHSHGAGSPLGNWLSIDGQVHEQQLSLSWVFDRQLFQKETIEHLAEDFEYELRNIVAHCETAGGFTPSDFPLAGLDQPQLDALIKQQPDAEDIYPLSPMQSGMLFHALDNPTSGQYVNQLSVSVGGLDPERFRAAWQRVVNRHAILRSCFVWQGEVPLQVVVKHLDAPVQVLDWRGKTADDINRLEREEREHGFDLARLPLQRVLLVQLDAERYQLIWTSHHILLDGWSSARLMGEVLSGYHVEQTLPAAPSYRDYIGWLAQQDEAADERFWRQRLSELPAPTLLATVIPSRSAETGHGAVYTHLSEPLTATLQAFAQAQRITMNTLIQGAWLLLLQRYTGQSSVAFGTTVAGRPADLADVEEMLGLFINTLPVIQTPTSSQPVGEWLLELQNYNLELREHEHTPLYRVQRWAGQTGQALFDSIVVFENYPIDEALSQQADNGLRFGSTESIDVTSFAMDLAVSVGKRLEVEYLFRRDCLDADACATLRDHFETLLIGIAADPLRALGDLPMLGAAEQAQLSSWNQLEPGVARQPVHHWLSRVAADNPLREAVRCGDQSLTFAELEQRANRLAHHLRSEGVGVEVRVGVALPRSPEMIVALLAVLKAGAAYVPLDASYPRERLAYLMQDSGIALLLTDTSLLGILPVPEHVHA